ncbi:hypothetical protein ScalyP_jg1498 [Parmales sp. scaly parma]|nr:hypothetical protein ScalyP_jg1498 [Parmales sp. scaly parma]|tara:strand:+ start:57 stop:902 length:846 start_codon:yes stop_codon:yes gene_type:complete
MPLTGYSAHHILVALLAVPIVTFVSTYAISLSNGNMKYPLLFLSTSIEAKPASCIGTFGLSFTALCSPLIAFIRKNYVDGLIEENLKVDSPNFVSAKNINSKALRVALLAGFGGHGVASFQSVLDDCGGTYGIIYTHLLFATLFFGGGSFFSYYSHKLDLLLPMLGTERERFHRKIFCWGTFFQFCTVCVVFPFIVVVWGSTEFLTFLVACLEISMLCTFMSTYITFYGEFEELHFQLLIMNKATRYSINKRDNSNFSSKRRSSKEQLQLDDKANENKTVI